MPYFRKADKKNYILFFSFTIQTQIIPLKIIKPYFQFPKSYFVKLWKEIGDKDSVEAASASEETAKQLYAEVYRISMFHCRMLF